MSTHGRSLLVVTGAAFEARIAAGNGVSVLCSGGDPVRLRALLDRLDPNDFHATVSFGVAGGLSAALRPGDIVIAETVTERAGTRQASTVLNRAIQSALNAAGMNVRRSAVAGVDAPAMNPENKAELQTQTGADVVDMETHVVSAYASSHNLPWTALRAICDPASRVLPPLATTGLKPDGRIDIGASLRSLVGDPGQLPALIRTGLDTAIAMAALRRARRLLGSGFGLGRTDFR